MPTGGCYLLGVCRAVEKRREQKHQKVQTSLKAPSHQCAEHTDRADSTRNRKGCRESEGRQGRQAERKGAWGRKRLGRKRGLRRQSTTQSRAGRPAGSPQQRGPATSKHKADRGRTCSQAWVPPARPNKHRPSSNTKQLAAAIHYQRGVEALPPEAGTRHTQQGASKQHSTQDRTDFTHTTHTSKFGAGAHRRTSLQATSPCPHPCPQRYTTLQNSERCGTRQAWPRKRAQATQTLTLTRLQTKCWRAT